MKSIVLYIYFVFYMVGISFKRIKLNYLKKHKGEKAAQEYVYKAAKKWARHILKIVGVKVECEGMDNIPDEACCFISNHQGNFDFIAMMATIDKPIGFIAKKEMQKLKILSVWMKDLKCVFIDRNNIRESLKAINEGAENLKQGNSMLIFPEGTRSKGKNLGEFKKGSLKMALKAKAPIVPLTVDGSYKIFEDHNGWLRKGTIRLVAGKPIYPDELPKEEQKNLTEIIRNEIEKNL
ncbi:lysophospholipid acyltransferase family protein [Clostridium sp. MB40-C1]|uniref:lysophospholipid acyltransferase family protein n=1 Tax=Clostridium sp. MB40-C1 TaxID=3070996 RepID=UPI0027E094FA|nr:lysophospholipid acyltransferase family protein [Clostridium sp. MB40-C1]WMJ79076.1 lysophospholipid acyltransferase family protein [Clostridium sp. MB40-C1]